MPPAECFARVHGWGSKHWIPVRHRRKVTTVRTGAAPSFGASSSDSHDFLNLGNPLTRFRKALLVVVRVVAVSATLAAVSGRPTMPAARAVAAAGAAVSRARRRGHAGRCRPCGERAARAGDSSQTARRSARSRAHNKQGSIVKGFPHKAEIMRIHMRRLSRCNPLLQGRSRQIKHAASDARSSSERLFGNRPSAGLPNVPTQSRMGSPTQTRRVLIDGVTHQENSTEKAFRLSSDLFKPQGRATRKDSKHEGRLLATKELLTT